MTERDRVQEQQVVDFIREHFEREGYPPSMRQIASVIGHSHSTAHGVVKRLVKEGILEVTPGIRSVRIRSGGMKAVDEHI